MKEELVNTLLGTFIGALLTLLAMGLTYRHVEKTHTREVHIKIFQDGEMIPWDKLGQPKFKKARSLPWPEK